jgi:hypothetical protein
MTLPQTIRLALVALLFAGATLPARALQLGEKQAQILARHGAPGAEDRGKNLAMYFWEGWSAQLEFKDGAVHVLTYRRGESLQESEIAGLLNSNGGTTRWHEATPDRAETRRWVRDDGAVANCPAVRPSTMTFQVGEANKPANVPANAPAPKVVIPATPPAISTRPATYPKLLASNEKSEAEAKPVEAAAPAQALPAPKRSLPKLQAEELTIEPGLVGQKPGSSHADQRGMAAAEPVPAPMKDAATERTLSPVQDTSKSGGHALLWVSLAVLAVASGGTCFFLIRSRRGGRGEVKSSVVTPQRDSTKLAPVASPAFAGLRTDQFDLVVGEIFRRQGYTVELSAAAALPDTIDLTLRRDSETILVQSKHWKTPRVSEAEVGEFYGAMTASGAPRGIFVTAGSFAREALEFAESRGIELMDREALEESIAATSRTGENFCGITDWIEEFAANARIFDPECPACQGSMVVRHNRTSGAAFWGCRNHPRCPGRREPRLDLLTVAGAR